MLIVVLLISLLSSRPRPCLLASSPPVTAATLVYLEPLRPPSQKLAGALPTPARFVPLSCRRGQLLPSCPLLLHCARLPQDYTRLFLLLRLLHGRLHPPLPPPNPLPPPRRRLLPPPPPQLLRRRRPLRLLLVRSHPRQAVLHGCAGDHRRRLVYPAARVDHLDTASSSGYI
ncbi:uncharacterized protein A4U43_C07F8560 [Asparagus officinalis]|uniref:Uncharacterized protein n=1 Tax=Asparagus officinalis TaxID=4686 RepID=A0A5P1EDF5_ASPOF|nr:uncharacterized protein A4U43_C07F8560 [Asparagus officinalis]